MQTERPSKKLQAAYYSELLFKKSLQKICIMIKMYQFNNNYKVCNPDLLHLNSFTMVNTTLVPQLVKGYRISTNISPGWACPKSTITAFTTFRNLSNWPPSLCKSQMSTRESVSTSRHFLSDRKEVFSYHLVYKPE